MLTANAEFHWHTKNIKMQYYWIREKVDSKKLNISYISTIDMIANGLTKALDLKKFKTFQSIIGMYQTGSRKMTE